MIPANKKTNPTLMAATKPRDLIYSMLADLSSHPVVSCSNVVWRNVQGFSLRTP